MSRGDEVVRERRRIKKKRVEDRGVAVFSGGKWALLEKYENREE